MLPNIAFLRWQFNSLDNMWLSVRQDQGTWYISVYVGEWLKTNNDDIWKIKSACVLRLVSSIGDVFGFCLGCLCCLWWCVAGSFCLLWPPFFLFLPPFLPDAEPVCASLFLAPRTFRMSTSRSSSCQISPIGAVASRGAFSSVEGAPPSTWEGISDMDATASKQTTSRFICEECVYYENDLSALERTIQPWVSDKRSYCKHLKECTCK